MESITAQLIDSRLQELEIKCAFLERELQEWKDASRSFHMRLSHMEQVILKLEHGLEANPVPTEGGPSARSGAF